MKREQYLRDWVKGMYESQETYPGKAMTIKDAIDFLDDVARHPDQYLDPPEGLQDGELMMTWNEIHKQAIQFQADRERSKREEHPERVQRNIEECWDEENKEFDWDRY